MSVVSDTSFEDEERIHKQGQQHKKLAGMNGKRNTGRKQQLRAGGNRADLKLRDFSGNK